jgi:cytochrome c oxidase subunit 3
VHRTGELYGQYKTLDQQKETASLGMWIFLVQEILFFGGIFLAYTINRHSHPTAFGIGGNMLSLPLGAANTVVLIASSFTMAMAVWAAQTSKKQLVTLFLIATLGLGSVFLGVKVVEYKQKFDHHLIPGHGFDITYCSKSLPFGRQGTRKREGRN